jgi:hypothetical protein
VPPYQRRDFNPVVVTHDTHFIIWLLLDVDYATLCGGSFISYVLRPIYDNRICSLSIHGGSTTLRGNAMVNYGRFEGHSHDVGFDRRIRNSPHVKETK